MKANKKKHFKYWVIRNISKFFLKLFYRLQIYGEKNLIKNEAIIASNHVSFFDPAIIAASSCDELHFLARKSLFKGFFFKHMLHGLNAHPVSGRASDINVFKQIKQLLQEGNKIVLFPEGTRSYSDEIRGILPGVGFLAYLASSKIIPVYIHGAQNIWPRWKKFPKLSGKIICVFGQAINTEKIKKTYSKKEAVKEINKEMEASLKKLRLWVKNGCK